jgi:SAM-dependent methyltransferase
MLCWWTWGLVWLELQSATRTALAFMTEYHGQCTINPVEKFEFRPRRGFVCNILLHNPQHQLRVSLVDRAEDDDVPTNTRDGGEAIPESGAFSRPSSSTVAQPFGRQDYWESFYDKREEDFSWYASWTDMDPFVKEFVMPPQSTTNTTVVPPPRVLIPGVGSDAPLLLSMYQAGYTHLSAFDYASSSIDHCRVQLQLLDASSPCAADHIHLVVADATKRLPYDDNSFDIVLDKGTLDAIYIANKEWLFQAVQQLQRVVAPGGIVWSLSFICTQALRDLDCWKDDDVNGSLSSSWHLCADSTVQLVTTEDGYTSNNLDGDLLVWRKMEAVTLP